MDDDGNTVYTSETWTWENTYENDPEILRNHWPIIRNHTYSFTVLDTDKRMVMVKLEVLPWREIIDNSYSW